MVKILGHTGEFYMVEESLIPLGKTDIQIIPIGLGTWQWGDRILWNYKKTHTDQDVRAAFQVCIEAGINFFDTAEVYGSGLSEKLLGRYLKDIKRPVIVATKFMPFPWRFWKSALRSSLRASMDRLGLKSIDLYQIHWPFPPVPIETWMKALADVVDAGLVRAVGVSNYNSTQMRRAYVALSERDIHLASNQVEYNLLQRDAERSGLLALCQELGISLIAYSPLKKGILTGKYTPDNPPSGIRSRSYNRAYLAKVQPLIRLMRDIGSAHEGKTPAQVALNWILCKGGIAIPGAKNAHQAQENIGALGWRLTVDEVSQLDNVSEEVNP
jgi:aryl-alcohol dehydrogenase-like predicted oxidoreductase